MPNRRVAVASLGLILTCAAFGHVGRAPSEADRHRLVVLQFPIEEAQLHSKGHNPETIGRLQDRFRERITGLLAHDPRFDLVGRNDRAVDLVLFGTVERIVVEPQRIEIRISGERYNGLAGAAYTQVRLLDVATGKVTWEESFEVERLAPDRSARQMADSLLSDLAGKVVDALTAHIAPIVAPEVTAPGPVVSGDGDGDGIPDYLNRGASPADYNRDGLPDYLNRYFLRKRPMRSHLRRAGPG